jgi:hypothetical protein
VMLSAWVLVGLDDDEDDALSQGISGVRSMKARSISQTRSKSSKRSRSRAW